MNQFSIRDIENLCGVKAHTLRIWEQRYNLFVPKRKQSQHRVYDCDDLKELLRICFLYHNGYKISKIAELSPEQIQQEIDKIKPGCCNYEIFVHQLVDASIALDKDNFEKIVNNLVAKLGLEKCIILVFYPFLQRIGLLWMTNHVIPAHEHFSSHIIRKKIICGIDAQEIPKDEKHNVVVFSPPGELHEIPLLVINYFFRNHGIRTTYFGTNVLPETLHYYSRQHSITHLYLHVITHLDSCGMESVIKSLRRYFPDKKILVSGPACTCLQSKENNILHVNSLEDIREFAQSLSASS
jgi:MerR family transcriptional regulator, light-induced transcriptional regulator